MATIYQRGRIWWLNDAGRRSSLHTASEAEAQAALVTSIHVLTGTAAGPLFSLWAVEYCQWHSQEYPDSYFRTEQAIRSHLMPFFGGLPIGSITRQHLEIYKHMRLAAGAAPATVIKEMRVLQASINKAVAWEVIPRNRAAGVDPPRNLNSRPPRWYTRSELSAIYNADQLHAHIWRLYANTGMRRMEGLHLRRPDVGKEVIKIVSETDARTKSAKYRIVPITPGARIALEGLRSDSQYVMPQLAPESLSRAFSQTLDNCGLDGSLHCLRHTYGSHLVMAGVPLRTIQVLMGHSTVRVTEQYAHVDESHLISKASLLSL